MTFSRFLSLLDVVRCGVPLGSFEIISRDLGRKVHGFFLDVLPFNDQKTVLDSGLLGHVDNAMYFHYPGIHS